MWPANHNDNKDSNVKEYLKGPYTQREPEVHCNCNIMLMVISVCIYIYVCVCVCVLCIWQNSQNLKQNEAKSACAESTNKGGN